MVSCVPLGAAALGSVVGAPAGLLVGAGAGVGLGVGDDDEEDDEGDEPVTDPDGEVTVVGEGVVGPPGEPLGSPGCGA